MRKRTLLFRLVVPAALVALVAVLGTLQYRWLGQVSEADRERLQKSLRAQAQDLVDGFDSEVLWIEMAFQANRTAETSDAERAVRNLEMWREKSKFPHMVKNVYLVDGAQEEAKLQRLDTGSRSFVDVQWTDNLAALRSRPFALAHLSGTPPATPLPLPTDVLLLHEPIVASIPAVLVSLPANRFLAVQLDSEYIKSSVLPALAAEHLSGQDRDRYRIEVVATGGENGKKTAPVVFSRGMAPGARIDPKRADVVMPLLAVRLDLAPRIAPRLGLHLSSPSESREIVINKQASEQTAPQPHVGAKTGALAIFVQSRTTGGNVFKFNARTTAAAPGWQIRMQHPAGSLDAAVASARHRNLWLSFGILAVLCASVVLVLLNANRSERLAAQQMDFVATVSHELRTPLAVIRSAAQNLSAGVVTDQERMKHYGEMIDGEGRRLGEMVEQVLEYAGVSGNRTPARLRSLDVSALLQDVAASWTSMLAAQNIETAVEIPDHLPTVNADEAAIRRVLNNLIGNAAKHAADGRWIGVAARQSTSRGRQEVSITVSDRGKGIPAGDMPHIFEPFYRGHVAMEQQIPGNGLGLSLARRIVEAHGGRMSVKSSAGHGASFTVSLPVPAA